MKLTPLGDKVVLKAIKEEDADTLKAMFIESSKRRRNLEK